MVKIVSGTAGPYKISLTTFKIAEGTGGDADKMSIQDNFAGYGSYSMDIICNASSGFMAKNATSGQYFLSSDGKYITINPTGKTIISAAFLCQAAGGIQADTNWLLSSGWEPRCFVTGGDLRLYLVAKDGVWTDWTASIFDSAGSFYFTFIIFYV
jgi:hypothetical protein